MKIFITGSSGYIGREIIKKLSGKHDIVPFDLKEGQDILNFKQLKKAMRGCEIVVHLAAIRGPDETKSFDDYFAVNCMGTLNVAKACFENKIEKLIYSSSTGYYGLEKGIPCIKPLKEQNLTVSQHVKADDLNCRDCDIFYSTSKVISEQILANFGLTKKLQVLILRFGPIGGKPGEIWCLDGIKLKIENAIHALELAINNRDELWYESFTITDVLSDADISKAKTILAYKPL